MKNAGYFENCKGIIFGRPLMVRKDYDISYEEAIKDIFKGEKFPVIIDADIGHVPPQFPIVMGLIISVYSQSGKGEIKTFF